MVDNVNGLGGMGGVQQPRRTKTTYRISEANMQPVDSVEFKSDVMRITGLEGIRLDKVMAIRSEIAEGDYFTTDKLEIALDKALDDALGQLFGGR